MNSATQVFLNCLSFWTVSISVCYACMLVYWLGRLLAMRRSSNISGVEIGMEFRAGVGSKLHTPEDLELAEEYSGLHLAW